MLYGILVFVILGATSAFAIEHAPATRVSVVTNKFMAIGPLPTNTVQAALDALNGVVYTNNVNNTNDHAGFSSSIIAVSNLAESALSLIAGATGVIQTARTYVYAYQGAVSITNATAGQAYFQVDEPSVWRLYEGMAISGTVFSAGTIVTNVDRTTFQIRVNSNLTGSASIPTNHYYYTLSTGLYTHVVPNGYSRSRVYVTGGGGAGGSASGTSAGQGGGAGGTAIGYLTVIPGTSVEITAGKGASAPATGNGAAGGTSSYGTLMTAVGGSGGTTAGDLGGVAGGTAAGGYLNLTGGPGGAVQDFYDGAGLDEGEDGGQGGASFWGGGGAVTQEPGAGNPGTAYGSGGAGAGDAASAAGGAGASGVVVIEYY